jgi:hypothetical protein
MDHDDRAREAEDHREPRKCPQCESVNLTTEEDEAGWWVVCGDCGGAWGPCFKKPDMIVKI